MTERLNDWEVNSKIRSVSDVFEGSAFRSDPSGPLIDLCELIQELFERVKELTPNPDKEEGVVD